MRIFAGLATFVAAWNLIQWLALVASGLPIGYGEGAVVHAGQILARGGDPYAIEPTRFVSANYPPLGYVAVALGLPLGPFTGLRVTNVVAVCGLAALTAWLARGSPARAFGLGASLLALYPVGAWTPGDRVDLLAVALAGAAIVALTRRGSVPLFGVLGALALAAKPTAALPLAAVLAYLLLRDRARGTRAAVALAVAGLAAIVIALSRFDPRGLYEHLVVYNAFPYDVRNPALLAVVGALLLGGFVVLALRQADPAMRAYVVGAAAVILLGGHEGATINYLLDLAAASCLALATSARGWPLWGAPVLAGQLAATLLLTTIGPFAPASLDALAMRATIARDLPLGAYYAEDSGLLVAAGIEPIVDDSFVWARLVALGVRSDDVTPRVASRSFAAILSDVPLEDIGRLSELERLRWPAELAREVVTHYELDRSVRGAYRYVPRR
ncbi:MAG TPA: hypothetical protein VJQ09_03000 [Candidatus Limnocylindria bacterium]|nr:hypothetical protein [Candidatus Limnocylindria bacterium]